MTTTTKRKPAPYQGYTINSRGPKKDTRSQAKKDAELKRVNRLSKIDDMEFAKRLGIFGELY